ncbi:TPA: type IV secretory system conjugative DNA transfer family protein [Serratia marcescens]
MKNSIKALGTLPIFDKKPLDLIKENKEKFKIQALSKLFSKSLEKKRAETSQFVDDVCNRHDFNNTDPELPPDLKDIQGDMLTTRNGYPVAGRVLPDDFSIGSVSPSIAIFLALWSVVYTLNLWSHTAGIGFLGQAIVLAYLGMFWSFFGFGKTVGFAIVAVAPASIAPYITPFAQNMGFSSGFVNLALGMLPATFPLIHYNMTMKRRAIQMQYNSATSNRESLNGTATINISRQIQAEQAKKDKSDFLTYGHAKGTLANMGDKFAPDNGLPVGITVNELFSHEIIFGSTRTGKTTGAVRPTINELRKQDCGLYLGDGKGSLPRECASFVQLIDHENCPDLNFIDDLEPAQLANLLRNQFGSKDKGDYWTNQAEMTLVPAKVFYDELALNMKVIPNNYSSFIEIIDQMKVATGLDGDSPDITKHPLLSKLVDNTKMATKGTMLYNAFIRVVELSKLADATKTGIFSTVDSMVLPFIQNEKLLKWSQSTTSTFNVERVMFGEKFGINLPEKVYGMAGLAIAKMLKAKVYNAIYKRGENWQSNPENKRVYFVIDECHLLMDSQDAEMLSILAGLGGTAIFATQNIDSLIESMGEHKALVMIDCFRNLITFRTSPKTYEYVAKKVGNARIKYLKQHSNDIDMGNTIKAKLATTMLDPTNPYNDRLLGFGRKFLKASTSHGDSLKGYMLGKQSEMFQPAIIVKAEQATPLFNETVIDALNEPFTCFVSLERASIPRRDVIKTIPLNGKFEHILK